MKAFRSEIERLVPSLRQLARALVESHRADIADDLVHDALDEALAHERHWTVGELEVRLFTAVIGANRLRLRAELGERRTLPGGGGRGEPSTPARPSAPTSREGAHGLDSLPLGDREALLLAVLTRLDYVKLAEILGVPTSSLISRLVRARDSLGTTLWTSGVMSMKPAARARSGTHLRLVKS